ncbi:hypothetical protein [Actinophytocola oryzae]|uniref:Tetratricopeptide repeat protein n=1 Tax=Actinophytocola oryzae TaxID=502181 RepID=A0A4R7VBS3_9PSEU|nr:hypothetical protein [Actinophytocola oryzae]TDV46388.1 hypothetical protein CLV71_111348 [Actinophytocola oryzae]
MTGEKDVLLAAPRAALARVRRDPDDWDGEYDYGLLLAMYFDGVDLPLARRMLAAAVRYHRDHVPPGISPELVRAGLLVACHGDAADVWLHWTAYALSFDPGYRPLLAVAGLRRTRDLVRESTHPDRGRVAVELAGLRAREVTAWLDEQRERFPSDPAAESLFGWSTHARELGRPDLSRELLLAWARERPHDPATFAAVRSRLGRLGFAAEAVEAQREAVAITTGRERLGHELVTLASVCREAGDLAGARQALEECAALAPPLGGLATSLRREARELDALRPGTPSGTGP